MSFISWAAPCHRAPIHVFADSTESILKNYERSRLETDPRRYCDRMMFQRYLEAQKDPASGLDQMSDEEIERKSKELMESDGMGGFVALPDERFTETVAQNAVLLSNPGGEFLAPPPPKTSSLKEAVSQALEVIDNQRTCELPFHKGQTFKELIGEKGLLGASESWAMTAAQQVGGPVICLETAPLLENPRCAKALNRNAMAISQRGTPPIISMPDVLEEVIQSGRFDKALIRMAKLMAEKIKQPDKITSDVFTDLTRSFQQTGASDAESRKLAIQTLGVVATGGPALATRMQKIQFSADRWPVATSLSLIAGLLPLMDYHSSKSGNLYSFPPGVEGRCNTSKSYHFWIAAYLARAEVDRGTSPETASAAAFSVSKLYHVVGNLTNRTGSYSLLQHRPFSPATMIVRADLAYASAGAVFGASDQLRGKIQTDKIMGQLIDTSSVRPALSKEEAVSAVSPLRRFGYGQFQDIYSPNTAYQQAARNLGTAPAKEFPRNLNSGKSVTCR